MHVEEEKLLEVVRKVKAVRDFMDSNCALPKSARWSIMRLRSALQKMYSLSILIDEVAFQSTHLQGMMVRKTENIACVYIKSELDEHDKRFVTVKELSQIIIDAPQDRSVDWGETIDAVIRESRMLDDDGDGHCDPIPSLQSEELAIFAAIELMYPFRRWAEDILRIAAGENTIEHLALEMELPAYCIETAHQHFDLFADLWSKV